MALDTNDDNQVIALAERLTGKVCLKHGSIAKRIEPAPWGNRFVEALDEIFAEPTSLNEAAQRIRERFKERGDCSEAEVRREIEAYLIIGSIGDDEHPPRLRPKLHLFFHGIVTE